MRARKNSMWSVSALPVLLLACIFFSIPAANAAFTSSARSSFPVSTLVLQSPVASITPTCTGGGKGKYRLNITVTSVGSVPRANAYVLIVTDPSGTIYTVDPASSGYSNPSATPGTWTYFVQAQYRVSGTTNVWKSITASPSTVSC